MYTIKRDGTLVPFDANKIERAIHMAFLKDADGVTRPGSSEASTSIREKVTAITAMVVANLGRHGDGTVHIEDIQDQVELALMRSGEQKVARDYVLYREKQAQLRAPLQSSEESVFVTLRHGDEQIIVPNSQILANIEAACSRWDWTGDSKLIMKSLSRLLFAGMSVDEFMQAKIMATRPLIETDPQYAYTAAFFLLEKIRAEAFGCPAVDITAGSLNSYAISDYKPGYFQSYIRRGVEIGRLSQYMMDFNLDYMAEQLVPSRDTELQYQGLQILYDRYLIHENGIRLETPQAMFMRVAMGLALNEIDREKSAVEFYNVLSTFHFVNSTPTLFNAGTMHPQLSSCYLTTVPDDLDGIFEAVKENALLSKFSGGLGNDWTPVRAMGSWIKGTNGKSQGVVPFLKVVNDTAVAVNQGGKRKGAVCAYLETWHMDIEEFLELRKNTGDDRRRTHDMNTAHWIPDLFMKRVMDDGEWTLFSPNEVSDLHDLFGVRFEIRYCEYEAMAAAGQISQFKKVRAVELWRKMLTMLFETGHPWITFKDPCNIRSPQKHAGVVHSSNLCTEITLNSSHDETAVCNLGSINLMKHLITNPVMAEHGDEVEREDWPTDKLRANMDVHEALLHIDMPALSETVKQAIRMLDNVIDINFYPTKKARNANMRHRAIGLGVMGFADALQALRIPMDSNAAITFASVYQEVISFFAIEASVDLAKERGAYSSFRNSDWSNGILPMDTVKLLAHERGMEIQEDVETALRPDLWDDLRQKVKHGIRHSNIMAIAPTATISNIIGVSQGIDPIYQNLYVKSNLSGEFTVLNTQMVADLEKLGLWDEVMVNDLKYFDGSIAHIERVPHWMKTLYATAFEIKPIWLVWMTAARQKWIDQSVSLNLYMAEPSGKAIDELYKSAWKLGLKTTYYLRTMGASSAEKSTINTGSLNAVLGNQPKACLIDDPTCEACQ